MSENTAFYAALENQFLTYEELAAVPVEDNGEAMVAIGDGFSGKVFITDRRMTAYTGENIYVRSGLVPMLERAQQELKSILPGCSLEVVYGYRHLDIQNAKFEAHKERLLKEDPTLSGTALKEAVHRFSAVPEVAGHPTGGAVDVRIKDSSDEKLPMGTEVAEYAMDTYTFSPFIAKEAWRNRQLLRCCMLRAGFAPFDGEWWHFSFGDREWAKYYNQPKAIYSQLRFTSEDATGEALTGAAAA
ncbi:M15 family metallopeptidase [Afifella sp. YEN Y35]|uniref:M15 family metallopeptidase n=1 Tax=Afifella sp. YEN Y35 TaxID=3388337 RepID=UPI0039E1C11E